MTGTSIPTYGKRVTVSVPSRIEENEVGSSDSQAVGNRLTGPVCLVLGWISLAIGIVGIVLPILPTTPLVLLAAFFFSRGSKRLHNWLLNQKTFGPIIREWESYGVIRPRMKWTAIPLLLAMLSYPIFFGTVPLLAKWIMGLVGIGVVFFIVSRPSSPQQARARLARQKS